MLTLRDLPAVDTLLNNDAMAAICARHGVQAVRDEIRSLQSQIRAAKAMPDWGTDPGAYAAQVSRSLQPTAYQAVFNLTGTIIHTNLGRALLSPELWRSIEPLVTRPVNLEYDLTRGKRGDRDAIIEERLIRLTGCEAATVVNNNAAALLLVLNTFGLGKPVPVSRGELIEIGGSFRLPDLMARSGCILKEVGTTNRTHLKDYAGVAADAAILLKVHPSNYHISGFAKEVSAGELAALAARHNIPSCVDLGAGTLIDLSKWGLPVEPTPQSVLEQGIDLVTFSGDKLLGGVQAGIIVGRRDLLEHIKTNPLKRALRADKITMAVLEATLKLYEDPESLTDRLPLLRTLTLDETTLRRRAAELITALPSSWTATIAPSTAQIGSGALPDKTISSIALTLSHSEHNANEVAAMLRGLSTPVIGRIKDDQIWLDMRSAEPLEELKTLLGNLPR